LTNSLRDGILFIMTDMHQILITFSSATFAGIVLVIISERIKIPAIVLLLFGGILLGPSGLGVVNPQSLGFGLKVIIQISVALILFEGGLNLEPGGYRQVSSEIKKALTVGVLATWVLGTLTVKFFFGFNWPFSILSASLIIVTGPTVIGPLLKRIRVKNSIHSFLYWEGVLIDPIGVFISLLCYEWIIGQNAAMLFFLRILVGTGIGLLSGFALSFIMKRRWIPEESLNVFILACAIAIFALSDLIVPESGLMSVVVAGFLVKYSDAPRVDEVTVYKAELIDLLIGLLFILLSAGLDIGRYTERYGIRIIAAVAVVMLAIRPMNIFLSTMGEKHFSIRERLFLGWIAPRGIVAASMASLFALNLREMNGRDYGDYEFLEAFTYAVIFGTVIVQGFSARWVERLTGALQPRPEGWVIIGANPAGRAVARFIQSMGKPVTCLDTNMHSIKTARKEGIRSISANALTIDPDDHPELYGMGNVLAVTENEELNELACQKWKKKLNKADLYKWRKTPGGPPVPGDDGARDSGMTVWTGLNLQQINSLSVRPDEFIRVESYGSLESIKHPDRALFFSGGGSIGPVLPAGLSGPVTCLMYRPGDLTIDFNIKPRWILYSGGTSMERLLRELLDRLSEDFPAIDTDQLHDNLIQQEKEYCSIIGYDISLPHAYVDGIDESMVLVSKSLSGTKCIFSSDPVSIVFLVLSPRNRSEMHINTLAKISRFISDGENRELLKQARSQEELVRVFFPANNGTIPL